MSRDIVALVVLCVIACASILLLQLDAKEIVLSIASGIVGYLSKSQKKEAAGNG